MNRLVPVIVCAFFFQTGCGDEIKDRFEDCRNRVENASNENAETLNPSLTCFTRRSRQMLANLMLSERKQGAIFQYMDIDAYKRLLSYTDMEESPSVIGKLALFSVSDSGAASSERAEIVFVKEDGEWRIDAMELPRFWLPLNLAMESAL